MGGYLSSSSSSSFRLPRHPRARMVLVLLYHPCQDPSRISLSALLSRQLIIYYFTQTQRDRRNRIRRHLLAATIMLRIAYYYLLADGHGNNHHATRWYSFLIAANLPQVLPLLLGDFLLSQLGTMPQLGGRRSWKLVARIPYICSSVAGRSLAEPGGRIIGTFCSDDRDDGWIRGSCKNFIGYVEYSQPPHIDSQPLQPEPHQSISCSTPSASGWRSFHVQQLMKSPEKLASAQK